MALAFQNVFDRAETISIITRPTVDMSITRNNTVRSVNRGGDTWRFSVTLPDGIPWTELRPLIAEMERLGTHTQQDGIQINNSGYNDWLLNYQGDSANTSSFEMNVTQGDTDGSISSYPAGHGMTAGDITFKAGDVVQLGTSYAYIVSEDTVYPDTTVYFNRAVKETSSTYQITMAPDVTWDLICVEMPQWNIFQRNQVSWSGAFVFYEVM